MEEQQSVTTSWHSYGKLFALGHRGIANIFDDEVIVEEKLDGSQFSFGIFGGEVKCRSKSATLNLFAPEKMFIPAVQTVMQLAKDLHPEWTYRCEFLGRPKHNSLVYNRVPNKFLIGFDINSGHESYLSYEDKVAEFSRLGLETVPLIYKGKVENVDIFRSFLDRVSCLGGAKIEGVVAKNYAKLNPYGTAMMGKFVSEEFKEIHSKTFPRDNPNSKDFIEQLVDSYRTPARFQKALQHLRELGQMEESLRGIPLLMKETASDIYKECADEIKEKLFEYAWPKISRGVTNGVPQWWKDQLLKASFETPAPEAPADDSAEVQP